MSAPWTRRRLLAGTAGMAVLAGLPAPLSGERATRGAGADAPRALPRDFGPFSMAIQSFTLRELSLEEMLDTVAGLGLRDVEAIPETKLWFWEFGSHVPVSDDAAELARVRALFEERGLRLVASGVHGIPDADRAERLFAFARALEVPVLTVDPAPEALDACDRLCAAHPEVRLAIHNHGPWTRYDAIADVEGALDGRHPGLGACVDTGHFIRSGEDPVEAVRRLGPRVHAVHLKDFAEAGLMPDARILGEGRLALEPFFEALLEAGFGADDPLSLEVEESPDDPLPAVRACLDRAADAIARVVA